MPHKPALPYTDPEVDCLLKAARTLAGFGEYGPRIEPMILLLRYSGLRMQDAACLERARLDGDKCSFTRTTFSTSIFCSFHAWSNYACSGPSSRKQISTLFHGMV